MSHIVYPKNTPQCIYTFVSYFENLQEDRTTLLSEIYEDTVIFQDPIHEILSIAALTTYFKELNKNVSSGGFTFTTIRIIDNTCYLEWTMRIQLRRPKKEVTTSGISVLSFSDKITQHRDYFDAGELFYEQIPILGAFIRLIKRKLAK